MVSHYQPLSIYIIALNSVRAKLALGYSLTARPAYLTFAIPIPY